MRRIGRFRRRNIATIKQIAELAGVSRGTVDRVLNNRPGVKPDTAELIRKIAAEVNYRPDLRVKFWPPGRKICVWAF